MRFLVDALLSPALARWLTAAGLPSEHVADLGLDAASDPRGMGACRPHRRRYRYERPGFRGAADYVRRPDAERCVVAYR
jgi:hypothetical protein